MITLIAFHCNVLSAMFQLFAYLEALKTLKVAEV